MWLHTQPIPKALPGRQVPLSPNPYIMKAISWIRGWWGAGLLLAMPAAFAQSVIEASQYPSIQAAIDAAPAGATVRLPAGRSVILTPLRLKSDLTIQGQANSELFIPNAIQIPAFTGEGTRTPQGRVMASGTNQFTLSDRTGLSEDTLLEVVMDDGSLDSHMNVVNFIDGRGQIRLVHPLPLNGVSGRTVFRVNPLRGVRLEGFRITGGANPILLRWARGIRLSNLTIVGSQGYAQVWRGYDVSMNRNVFDTVGGGLAQLSVTQGRITDNTVVQHQRAGAFMRSCTDGTMENNRMSGIPGAVAFGGNGDGLTVALSHRVRVINNDIRHTSCYGMWILDSDFTEIAGNRTFNCYTTSFYLLRGTGNVLRNNIASTNAVGFGFTVDGTRNTLMEGNTGAMLPRGYHIVNNESLQFRDNESAQNREADFFANNPGLVRD